MITIEQIEQLDHQGHFDIAINDLLFALENESPEALSGAQVHATLAIYKFLLEERDEEMEHARRQFEAMTKR